MAHHHHGHAAEVEGRKSQNGGNITIVFFLNIAFTIIEIAGGLLTNSLAILSDALHDLGDSLALGIAYLLERVSGKTRTASYSYGFRRYSLLSALINSLILLAGSTFILTQAIPRLLHPEQVKESGMIVLAVVGILVNGAAVFRLKGAKKLSERTVLLHLLEDVLGWAAVLVGAVVMMFVQAPIIDPALSLVITLYVLYRGIANLSQTMRIFLQGVPPNIDLDRLIDHVRQISAVVDVHDVHAWSMDGEYNVVTLHIVVPDEHPPKMTADLRKNVRNYLRENGIQHATIEIGHASEDCELSGC